MRHCLPYKFPPVEVRSPRGKCSYKFPPVEALKASVAGFLWISCQVQRTLASSIVSSFRSPRLNLEVEGRVTICSSNTCIYCTCTCTSAQLAAKKSALRSRAYVSTVRHSADWACRRGVEEWMGQGRQY